MKEKESYKKKKKKKKKTLFIIFKLPFLLLHVYIFKIFCFFGQDIIFYPCNKRKM